jgi:hypothetical protein
MIMPVSSYTAVYISIALIMHCATYRSFVIPCKKTEETGVRFRTIKKSTLLTNLFGSEPPSIQAYLERVLFFF